MKFLKDNVKVIIGFIVGVILAGGIVYAATSASQVTYTTNKNAQISTVAEALNDLYNRASKSTPTEITVVYGSYENTGSGIEGELVGSNNIKKITIKNITYISSSFTLGYIKIGDGETQTFNSISEGDSFEINNQNFRIEFYGNATAKYGRISLDLIIE